MSISDLKFTEEEMAAKSVTALADRPALSAAEMKERLDSGDIRVKMNALMDSVETELAGLAKHQNSLMVFRKTSLLAVAEAMWVHGEEDLFFGFFLDTGKTFYGTYSQLQDAILNETL